MKQKNISQRGQALVIITLAAIGLFAIVGLAIDGSAKFSDRRHAQNAADTAVMAAALAKIDGIAYAEAHGLSANPGICPPLSGLPSDICTDLLNAGWDRAASNGYDGYTNNTVEIYSPPISGPYIGDTAYVQAVINSDVDTLFARVIGIDQTHNTVQAVAYTKKRGPFYDGALVVALNPNPCSGAGADGNITLGTSGGGSGIINFVGGGAFVNSTSGSCGMTLTGCPTINITDGVIGSAGTGNIDLDNSSGTCSSTVTGVDEVSYGNEPYPFPPEMPEEPSECSTSTLGTFSSNSTTKITTLNPGRYNEFPPKSGGGVTIYDHVEMNPGIYCVNNVIKLVDQKLRLHGDDVTIYIRPGYSFSFAGGSIDLDAPNTGDYAGYVIIVASNFTGSPQNCKIDGNGANAFTGTIFAPYCNLTINGTSDPTSYSAQIIAYTVKLNGSAAVNLYYNEGDNAKNYPKIGLMK